MRPRVFLSFDQKPIGGFEHDEVARRVREGVVPAEVVSAGRRREHMGRYEDGAGERQLAWLKPDLVVVDLANIFAAIPALDEAVANGFTTVAAFERPAKGQKLLVGTEMVLEKYRGSVIEVGYDSIEELTGALEVEIGRLATR